MRRLKTVRRPPIYPNGAQAISPVAPSPLFRCPHAVHRCPSVDSGLGYHTADSRPLSGSRCGAPLLGRLAGLTEKVPVFGQLLLEEVLSEGLFLLCDCDVQSGPAAVPPLG